MHNVTTKHLSDHFQAQDSSLNFTVKYDNYDTLAASKALFMSHDSHSAISNELKELLWTTLTRPQRKLVTPIGGMPLRDQLRHICRSTPYLKPSLRP